MNSSEQISFYFLSPRPYILLINYRDLDDFSSFLPLSLPSRVKLFYFVNYKVEARSALTKIYVVHDFNGVQAYR
jgi:hypothetical protein